MLVLNALVRKSSDLLDFTLQCSNVFIQVRNVCFTDRPPGFVGHSFRVEGETWYIFSDSSLCILI